MCCVDGGARRPSPSEPARTRPEVARLAHAHSPRAARRPPPAPWYCPARCRPSRRPARTRPSAPESCAAPRRACRPPGSPGPTGAPAPPCRLTARPTSVFRRTTVPGGPDAHFRPQHHGFRRAGSPRPASKLRFRQELGPCWPGRGDRRGASPPPVAPPVTRRSPRRPARPRRRVPSPRAPRPSAVVIAHYDKLGPLFHFSCFLNV